MTYSRTAGTPPVSPTANSEPTAGPAVTELRYDEVSAADLTGCETAGLRQSVAGRRDGECDIYPRRLARSLIHLLTDADPTIYGWPVRMTSMGRVGPHQSDLTVEFHDRQPKASRCKQFSAAVLKVRGAT